MKDIISKLDAISKKLHTCYGIMSNECEDHLEMFGEAIYELEDLTDELETEAVVRERYALCLFCANRLYFSEEHVCTNLVTRKSLG